MRRTWGFIFVLLVPTISYADSFGGFVSAGYSGGSFSVEADPPASASPPAAPGSYSGDDPESFTIDLEDGRGGHLTAGFRFKPGIMVRGSFDTTTHEGFTACAAGGGCMKFSDEFKRTESRFGVFYAPQFNQVVGLRTGLGFEKITIEAPTISSTDAVSDGGFVELAVLLNAGKAVTFDIGGALFGLENDDAEDVIGAEFAIGATFHAGPVDIGLMGRAISLETDLDGGETITEDFSEGRVTIGTSWGYLSRNRPSPALSASPAPPSAEAALITPAAVLKATATSTSPAASAFTPPTQPAPVIERPSNAPPVAVASTTPSEMVAPDLMPLTPAPVAPIQSASLVAGKTVKLVLGAKLRTRPTADATPSPNTPVDLLAVLESSVRNREGVWWYVSFSSGAAWVLEREFDLQVP